MCPEANVRFCGTTVAYAWRDWHEPRKTQRQPGQIQTWDLQHKTAGLITQPWRSVKNIQTNDRQERWKRWTFGFSRRTKFRCQLNKLCTQEYRRVTNWLLDRHKKKKLSYFCGRWLHWLRTAHQCLWVQDTPSSSYLWIRKSNDSWQTYKSDS